MAKPPIDTTPHPKLPGRNIKGQFIPKTPLGDFNSSLNVGKERPISDPNRDVTNKANQITNITNNDAIESLLRNQNKTLDEILNVSEITNIEQKQFSDSQNQKQTVIIQDNTELIGIETQNKEILESIDNALLVLGPDIKEIAKLTQLDNTQLRKILDSQYEEGIKSKGRLFAANHNNTFGANENSRKGAEGEGEGLGALIGEGLGGLGALETLRLLRKSQGGAKPANANEKLAEREKLPAEEERLRPANENELKPAVEEPIVEPMETKPTLNAPKGLGGAAEGAGEEAAGFIGKFKRALGFLVKKGLTKTAAASLIGGLIGAGLGIDAFLGLLVPSNDSTEQPPSSFKNRFAPITPDIPSLIIHPAEAANTSTQTKPDFDVETTAKRDKPNEHGGVMHDWRYRSQSDGPKSNRNTLVHPVNGGVERFIPDPASTQTFQPGTNTNFEPGLFDGNKKSSTQLSQPSVPYTPGMLTKSLGVNDDQYNSYKESISKIESGGKYDIMGGSSGKYVGRYQLGPEAIHDAADKLGIPIPTNAQLLSSPKLQEQMFEAYTQLNNEYLTNNSKQYVRMSPEQKLALLGYAHNQGAAGAAKYLETGREGRDSFGTSGTAYSKSIAKNLAQLQTQAPKTQVADVPKSTEAPKQVAQTTPPSKSLQPGTNFNFAPALFGSPAKADTIPTAPPPAPAPANTSPVKPEPFKPRPSPLSNDSPIHPDEPLFPTPTKLNGGVPVIYPHHQPEPTSTHQPGTNFDFKPGMFDKPISIEPAPEPVFHSTLPNPTPVIPPPPPPIPTATQVPKTTPDVAPEPYKPRPSPLSNDSPIDPQEPLYPVPKRMNGNLGGSRSIQPGTSFNFEPELFPKQSSSASTLTSAAKSKENAEDSSKQQQAAPVIIDNSSKHGGGQNQQVKGTIPSVRNDDPIILQAFKADLIT